MSQRLRKDLKKKKNAYLDGLDVSTLSARNIQPNAGFHRIYGYSGRAGHSPNETKNRLIRRKWHEVRFGTAKELVVQVHIPAGAICSESQYLALI